MARWMINCREHSRLMSEGMDHPLTFWDRLSIRIHQWICPPCNRLGKQFDAIRKACRRIPAESDKEQGIEKPLPAIPEDACQRMKALLRHHLK